MSLPLLYKWAARINKNWKFLTVTLTLFYSKPVKTINTVNLPPNCKLQTTFNGKIILVPILHTALQKTYWLRRGPPREGFVGHMWGLHRFKGVYGRHCKICQRVAIWGPLSHFFFFHGAPNNCLVCLSWQCASDEIKEANLCRRCRKLNSRLSSPQPSVRCFISCSFLLFENRKWIADNRNSSAIFFISWANLCSWVVVCVSVHVCHLAHLCVHA